MKNKNDAPRLLYSRKQTAERLGLSVSTVDVLISRGLLASRQMGRKRLIPDSAIVAFSKKNLPRLWPLKVHGKTTRHLENSEGNARRSAIAC